MIPEHHLIVVLSSTIASIAPPPSYFHLDIYFFTHGTLSSSPFIPLPTLWLTCPSSTSPPCFQLVANIPSITNFPSFLFPFHIHPSIQSLIHQFCSPSSHLPTLYRPLSPFHSFFLSLSLKFV